MPQDLICRATLAGLALLCTGCTASGPWPLGSHAQRALAPPDAVTERSFQQILTLDQGEHARRFIAAGHVCDAALMLALLTPQGIEVMRLRHSRDGLEIRHERGLPPGVTPTAILADFQLIHWPAPALRAAWAEPWALEIGPDHREASYRGQPRVRVRYTGARWTDPSTLEDARRGYRLRVETREHVEGDCGGSARAAAALRGGRTAGVGASG